MSPADPIASAQRLARPELPKRFYKAVGVEHRDEGWAVTLDGRAARTPAKHLLAVPSEALARALCEEWDAQGETVDPARMPLTRIVNVVIDAVVHEPGRVADEVVRYAGSDLLCYRADEPPGLVAAQGAHWDPLLRWAAEGLGARLVCAVGVTHVAQPQAALEAVAEVVQPLDPYRLAAVSVMTTLSGSAVIALAVLFRHVGLEEAWAAAHVDEDWNISQWGEDAEAAARRAFRKAEMDAAARLLTLLG